MFEVIIYIIAFNFAIQHEQPQLTSHNPVEAQKSAIQHIPTPTSIPTEAPEPKLQGTKHVGLASYYSRAGCVGCSPNLSMANGQPLDDSRLTVAFNRAPLGTMVKITNVQTGASVIAETTDRGGFEKLPVPKIVDLSVATKEAIGCSDICQVEIEL